jgi:hypothetical protein
VTADENERLRRVEARGVFGWEKYAQAEVSLVEQHGETWVPLDLLTADLAADAPID